MITLILSILIARFGNPVKLETTEDLDNFHSNWDKWENKMDIIAIIECILTVAIIIIWKEL